MVLFESDDWGSVRMPSKTVYNYLLDKNLINPKDHFARLDSLEKTEDLEFLFEVLSSVKDSQGRSAVLTADTIVANPDFAKIKEGGYQSYFFESADQTMKRFSGSEGVLKLWQKGNEMGCFKSQLHGREHVNIREWLNALQSDQKGFRAALERETFALSGGIAAAFNAKSKEELDSFPKILTDAQAIFEGFFGKPSETFIAPNYTWPIEMEKQLADIGVIALQGSRKQKVPNLQGQTNFKFRFTGRTNPSSQYYLVRNALYEPSISPESDYVSACLRNVSIAFKWGVPAIVGTHRINYVSRLDVKNRDQNLRGLKTLLTELLKRWPDIRFMSSDEFVHTYLLKNVKPK